MVDDDQMAEKKELFAEIAYILAVYLVDMFAVTDPLPDVKGRVPWNHTLSDFGEAEDLLTCCGVIALLQSHDADPSGDNPHRSRMGITLSQWEMQEHVETNFKIIGWHLDWLIHKAINLMADYTAPLGPKIIGTSLFAVPPMFSRSFELLHHLGYVSRERGHYLWTDKGFLCIGDNAETWPTIRAKDMFSAEVRKIWRCLPDEFKEEFKWPSTRSAELLIANHWYDGCWHHEPVPVLSKSRFSAHWPSFIRSIAVSKIADPAGWNRT